MGTQYHNMRRNFSSFTMTQGEQNQYQLQLPTNSTWTRKLKGRWVFIRRHLTTKQNIVMFQVEEQGDGSVVVLRDVYESFVTENEIDNGDTLHFRYLGINNLVCKVWDASGSLKYSSRIPNFTPVTNSLPPPQVYDNKPFLNAEFCNLYSDLSSFIVTLSDYNVQNGVFDVPHDWAEENLEGRYNEDIDAVVKYKGRNWNIIITMHWRRNSPFFTKMRRSFREMFLIEGIKGGNVCCFKLKRGFPNLKLKLTVF